MASRVDDRWLWLGLGVFFFAAAKGIAYALRDVEQLTEIRDPDYATRKDQTQAEESIGLDTLRTLSESPNPDISKAAISILLTRFVLSGSADATLTSNLLSQSPRLRAQARRVIQLFDAYPLAPGVPTPQILKYGHLLGLEDPNQDPIRVIIPRRNDREGLAGIAGQEEGRDAGDRLRSLADDVQELQGLSEDVAALRSAATQMLEVLRSRRRVEQEEEDDDEEDGESGEELTVQRQDFLRELAQRGLLLSDGLGGRAGGVRVLEESPEEMEVRRRRREAMVLHEGGGSIGREDIIHPRSDSW